MKAVEEKHRPASRLANKAEVVEFFGIHIPTLDSWVRKGCPYRQRGGRGVSWEFDLLEVAKWKYGGIEESSTDDPELMPPKERLDWYKGCRERDTFRREAGELIHVDDVIAEWTSIVSTTKARLMALPMRLAPDLVGASDLRAAEDAVKAGIIDALEDMSSHER